MVAPWKETEITNYQTPRKWGTGINPVHGIVDNAGRNTAPDTANYSGPPTQITSNEIPTSSDVIPDDGVWGAGEQTGTAEIPPYNKPNTQNRASSDGYPSWNRNGDKIRSEIKGSRLATLAKAIFSVPPYVGVKAKETGPENQPVVSDPSQYIVNTSMVQRDKSRNGTQNPGGRASKYVQTIGSRLAGMKKPQIYGAEGEGERHYAMVPKHQDTMVRPFWYRNAGTGPLPYLDSNEMYASTAMTREAPPQPDTGPVVAYDGNYLDGDQVWW